MKKRSIKAVSWFLAFVMLTSLLFTSSVTAFAHEIEPPRKIAAASSFGDDFDSRFDRSSYEYDHALARVALSLSLDSSVYIGSEWCSGVEYDRERVTPNTDELSARRYANIERAYSELGFDSALYYNYNVTLNDTSDKVAFSIGIKNGVSGATLITVVIRSTGYGAGWKSNLHLGSGEPYHVGFYTAAEAVLDKVIENPDFDIPTGEVKYFVTGLSRGGAVANVLSAMLDDAARDSDLFDPEDVYAYTFASPATVSDSMRPDDPVYENIHNIINSSDPIAHIIPKSWGFSRYGVTHRTSALTADGGIDKSVYERLDQSYRTLTGQGFDAGASLGGQAAVHALSEYISDKMPSPEKAEDLIETLREIFELLYTYRQDEDGRIRSISADEFAAILSERYGKKYNSAYRRAESSMKLADAAGAVELITEALGVDESYARLLFTVCELHSLSLIEIRSLVFPIINSFNFNTMLEGHYTQVYSAWMTLDEDECFGSVDTSAVTVLSIAGDVHVTVRTESGEEVVLTEDGDVTLADIPTVITDGITSIYFSVFSEQSYTVEIVSDGGGRVAYNATELDMSLTPTARAVYPWLELSDGAVLTLSLSVCDGFSNEKYDATVFDGETETHLAASDIRLGAPEHADLAIRVEGDGNVKGGGSYLSCDLVRIKASPARDHRFVGWFDGDALISDAEEYIIRVVGDTELRAVFESTVHDLPDESPTHNSGIGAQELSSTNLIIIILAATVLTASAAVTATLLIIRSKRRKKENGEEKEEQIK